LLAFHASVTFVDDYRLVKYFDQLLFRFSPGFKLLKEAATNLRSRKMATEAQLKLMMETVEKQKADIEAKEQIIIDRNKELALLQQDFQDRDRHSRDFIKEQEEKFKLIIRELEDKLKATSLSGVTAPLVAGTGTSSPSSSAMTDPYSTSTPLLGLLSS
jgi:septal ring factor EnvC (AmiA/AmiB activator)